MVRVMEKKRVGGGKSGDGNRDKGEWESGRGIEKKKSVFMRLLRASDDKFAKGQQNPSNKKESNRADLEMSGRVLPIYRFLLPAVVQYRSVKSSEAG